MGSLKVTISLLSIKVVWFGAFLTILNSLLMLPALTLILISIEIFLINS